MENYLFILTEYYSKLKVFDETDVWISYKNKNRIKKILFTNVRLHLLSKSALRHFYLNGLFAAMKKVEF